ncbi:MAG TPA: DUF3857 domain-containing protein, partial [Gemmatimonadales bacterium]|nr:DUF3857 domain-containing protein [Gemmatimonadales bacterium]
MLRTPLLGALLACCAASASLAQAPRVTSAGDPSIESDTIYRLVVDPKDHPEDDMVLLLDDGIVRVEPDGRTTQTYHQVVQILTEAGAREFQERSYSWAPDREKFHLNWFRVVRPDGTVISDGPTQSQEGDVPVAMGDPVYSQRKRLRISMSGIAAGVLVDYSTTREDTRTWIPGDFLTSWSIHTGSYTRRSRYILDVPAGMPLHLKEHNLTFTPRHETVRGREVTTWAAQDLPLVKPESFATDTGPKLMSFEISGPVTWERIGTWYAGLARDRYAVTPAVMAPLTAALAAAHDLRDTVRAVHRYV